ncbi:hypothetical protein GQX74_013175 [Glossina fuscipes]|nr:hypothetical protein GQX74_013175 [Glossina fuscipes]
MQIGTHFLMVTVRIPMKRARSQTTNIKRIQSKTKKGTTDNIGSTVGEVQENSKPSRSSMSKKSGAQATMRESPEVLPNPLKRRTRIQRSPEQMVGNHTQVRSHFSPPILQEKTLMIRKDENSFVELGEKIGELIEMTAPTPSAPARRIIHQPMRDFLNILAVLHKRAAIELGNQMAKKAVGDGTTQTENGGRVNATKRLREERSADTTPAKKSKRAGDGINPNKEVPKQSKFANEEWTVVQFSQHNAKVDSLNKQPANK